jgi:nicotinamide riboside transporter PnuC
MSNIEIFGWSATAVALMGVWMNNKRRRACFALWLVSNAMTFVIHAVMGMWPLAARDGAFFVMAIHGWWLWRSPNVREEAHESAQSADR